MWDPPLAHCRWGASGIAPTGREAVAVRRRAPRAKAGRATPHGRSRDTGPSWAGGARHVGNTPRRDTSGTGGRGGYCRDATRWGVLPLLVMVTSGGGTRPQCAAGREQRGGIRRSGSLRSFSYQSARRAPTRGGDEGHGPDAHERSPLRARRPWIDGCTGCVGSRLQRQATPPCQRVWRPSPPSRRAASWRPLPDSAHHRRRRPAAHARPVENRETRGRAQRNGAAPANGDAGTGVTAVRVVPIAPGTPTMDAPLLSPPPPLPHHKADRRRFPARAATAAASPSPPSPPPLGVLRRRRRRDGRSSPRTSRRAAASIAAHSS